MAIPTIETSGLKLSIDTKGNLHLYHLGKFIPTSSITIQSMNVHTKRGYVTVTIPTQFVEIKRDER